jgi:sec-independent protein translocase protein TatA
LELILIFLAVLLIFGAKRIPEIARGMGKGIREFKAATREISDELTIEESKTQRVQPPRPPVQGTPAPRTPEEPARPSTEGDAGKSRSEP